jgi:tRNA(Ile)-lysidine synthase
MDGTKSLQDLFTDRGVPRSARRDLPVVVARGRVAWVAGVAVSEDFRLVPSTRQVAVLTCRALG